MDGYAELAVVLGAGGVVCCVDAFWTSRGGS